MQKWLHEDVIRHKKKCLVDADKVQPDGPDYYTINTILHDEGSLNNRLDGPR